MAIRTSMQRHANMAYIHYYELPVLALDNWIVDTKAFTLICQVDFVTWQSSKAAIPSFAWCDQSFDRTSPDDISNAIFFFSLFYSSCHQ